MTLPFFVLHGEADTVTDPEVSRALYERASTVDKTMKMYPGMWHALTSGEPDENIEIVFSDILSWLDKRSGDGGAPTIESSNRHRRSGSEGLAENKENRKMTCAKNLCGLKGRRYHHHSAM